jgi:hypothetical protein
VRTFILAIAKRILPKRFIDWYRRRRALRRYLKALAFEIYDRGIRLEIDDLEGRIAARRDGFYDRLVKDVLERTELVLQELDRKVEGLTARHGSELRHLQSEITELRTAAHELRTTLPPGDAEPRMAEGSPASAER